MSAETQIQALLVRLQYLEKDVETLSVKVAEHEVDLITLRSDLQEFQGQVRIEMLPQGFLPYPTQPISCQTGTLEYWPETALTQPSGAAPHDEEA